VPGIAKGVLAVIAAVNPPQAPVLRPAGLPVPFLVGKVRFEHYLRKAPVVLFSDILLVQLFLLVLSVTWYPATDVGIPAHRRRSRPRSAQYKPIKLITAYSSP
jgi:hypothetical protein